MPKSAATRAVPRAGVLKISTGVKRPSAELLPAPKGKHVKVSVALYPASAPIHRAAMRPQPPTESDDGRVAVCATLEAPSVVSSSTSSSSDPSGSESIMALAPPVPDLLISAGLEDIPEMTEVEVAYETVNLIETVPCADISADMLLYIL
jgi:hypothetical protein